MAFMLLSCNFWLSYAVTNLNLIPKFNFLKKSKCHVCVESK